MKRAIYFAFILGVIFLNYEKSIAQNEILNDGDTSNCAPVCNDFVARCQFQRASYLLMKVPYRDVSACIDAEYTKFDSLSPIARNKLGIDELNKVISNPSGLIVSALDLKRILAGAKLSLSQRYFEAGEYDAGRQSIKDAGEIYLSVSPQDAKTVISEYLINAIAVGLIRTGNSFEALRLIDKLPAKDTSRAYLAAEAFFAMGNRQTAAEKYEQWITLGCDAEISMITRDEYYIKWGFIYSVKPAGLTHCEQLPIELRSRLETLAEQFRHPNNLPTRSVPGFLVRY